MSVYRFLPLLICMALAACAGTSEKGGRLDYAKAKTLPPLDVPPPLQMPVEGAEALGLPATPEGVAAGGLLPTPVDARVERAGELRWLVVSRNPEELWTPMRQFLEQQGLEIAREEPRIGLFETQWAENRADIPEDFIRGAISKIAPKLYSASTRDRYRLRLERGQVTGTTEIFISHYGVEQVTKGDTIVWQPRPSDPELTAEMLSRLMLALGTTPVQVVAEQQVPAPAVRARLEGESVVVSEGFARAWRRVGIAIDRIGLVVEDLDRSKGLYWVRVSEEGEKKGWFAGLFAEEQKDIERSFRVKVDGNDTTSRVTLETEAGETVSEATRRKVLGQLEEELR